jgi:hypothetical protein
MKQKQNKIYEVPVFCEVEMILSVRADSKSQAEKIVDKARSLTDSNIIHDQITMYDEPKLDGDAYQVEQGSPEYWFLNGVVNAKAEGK